MALSQGPKLAACFRQYLMNPYIGVGGLLLVLGYVAHRWFASRSFSPPEALMFVGFTATATTTAASGGREWIGWLSLAGTVAMFVGVVGMKMRPKPDHTKKRSP